MSGCSTTAIVKDKPRPLAPDKVEGRAVGELGVVAVGRYRLGPRAATIRAEGVHTGRVGGVVKGIRLRVVAQQVQNTRRVSPQERVLAAAPEARSGQMRCASMVKGPRHDGAVAKARHGCQLLHVQQPPLEKFLALKSSATEPLAKTSGAGLKLPMPAPASSCSVTATGVRAAAIFGAWSTVMVALQAPPAHPLSPHFGTGVCFAAIIAGGARQSFGGSTPGCSWPLPNRKATMPALCGSSAVCRLCAKTGTAVRSRTYGPAGCVLTANAPRELRRYSFTPHPPTISAASK